MASLSILHVPVQVPLVPSRHRWRSDGFAVSSYSSTPQSIFVSSTMLSIRFAASRRSRSCAAACGRRFGSISDRSQAAASADAARVVDN
jgi:hypothetical protein